MEGFDKQAVFRRYIVAFVLGDFLNSLQAFVQIFFFQF